MENKPKLSDPKEWAIIREMYFDTSDGFKNDIEAIERLERMESKNRNLQSTR